MPEVDTRASKPAWANATAVLPIHDVTSVDALRSAPYGLSHTPGRTFFLFASTPQRGTGSPNHPSAISASRSLTLPMNRFIRQFGSVLSRPAAPADFRFDHHTDVDPVLGIGTATPHRIVSGMTAGGVKG